VDRYGGGDRAREDAVKIVHLSGVEVPSRTAASVQVMNMCAAFAELGHRVELIAAPGKIAAADFRFYGLEPTFSIRRISRRSVAAHAIAAAAAASDAELIYARDRLAALLAIPHRAPIIYESHVLPAGARRTIERTLLRSGRVVRLVLHTQALADAYRAAFGRLPPLVIAPNGAREKSDAPVPELPAGFRVGYVGSDYPGRGLDVVDALAARMRDVDFHVIGRERVVSPFEAEGWCRAMDVLLLPYREGTRTRGGVDSTRWMSPLKLFEAMAAGKAIVASELPALREVIDESNALLVPPGDVDAWASAIDRLRDPALRDRLGSAARARFLAEHTWRKRAEKVLAF
jgi:glycosyltransferase involved in cell wall biosynthesis